MARDDTAREHDSILDRGSSGASAGTAQDPSNVVHAGRDYTVRTIGGEGMFLTIVEGRDVSQ
ncbi:hypothetical protein [Halorussus halophilus]|uniref:hypothetical protein n=1 Tax=Halorussus halophilus TaxID=2650975 RepID=UPI00130123D7|nr:hypothetical protein [Halorussus halophilus]